MKTVKEQLVTQQTLIAGLGRELTKLTKALRVVLKVETAAVPVEERLHRASKKPTAERIMILTDIIADFQWNVALLNDRLKL